VTSKAPSVNQFPMTGALVASETHRGVTYLLERGLGSGGTSTAYLATRQAPEGRSPSVVKVVHPHLVAEPSGKGAVVVLKEAVALGRLNERVPPTPYVVRFLDVGTVDFQGSRKLLRLPWLAVEYVHGGVEGTTLEERVDYALRQTGLAFDAERAARCVLALGTGLSEIHQVGVVHRDFTPGNVLCCGVGESEVFKISDFGIARSGGLAATFGDMLIGTPGYVAPEQAFDDKVEVGSYTDIFSLACVIYFILTGKPYFQAQSAQEAMLAARLPERRSIRESEFLCHELRANPAACAAIDAALARATQLDTQLRPSDAVHFATSLIPWITETPRRPPSRRLMDSYMRLRITDTLPGWVWNVRHAPGDDRVIVGVGWEGDGHCLAATTQGLQYWNGVGWQAAPGSELPVPNGIRFVQRTQPGQWLIGSDGATLAVYSRNGVTKIVRGPDESASFLAVSGHIDDLAVVLAEKPRSPPLLYGIAGGYWLRPLSIPAAAAVSSVTRIDSTRWLVVGRSERGGGFAAIYAPLMWELEPVPIPQVRPLVACASHVERGVALAVGGQGTILRFERGGVSGTMLDGAPFLASVALDVLDREWAGGSGRLWVSAGGGSPWNKVYEDPAWKAPFISILADVGLLVAMTVDGGVLECRSAALDGIVQGWPKRA
jgi:serine/threonine protein kinase